MVGACEVCGVSCCVACLFWAFRAWHRIFAHKYDTGMQGIMKPESLIAEKCAIQRQNPPDLPEYAPHMVCTSVMLDFHEFDL